MQSQLYKLTWHDPLAMLCVLFTVPIRYGAGIMAFSAPGRFYRSHAGATNGVARSFRPTP